ncbi:hypothetical protein B0H16DRAFT_1633670 [Mycena metata]|uniref:Uncharacterized protein n=1 Tax=Mycena metata TaxID=1033252 RepID=A0AAD7GX59_9AGAR|nr:hypothetical protein B0H16DRAFT_1633670 [Mycena metata]
MTADMFVQRLMNPKPVRTPEDEDQVILEMACGFAAPEDPSDWDTILLEAGIHSEQKMTIQTITAIAAAKVPGQPIPLVAAESNILSFVKTTCANTYAAERVLICETMYTQCGWNKLPVATKAVHNRALFIAQNPVLFDKCKTDDEKQKELDAKHTCAHAKFLKNDRDQLTRWRNQVSNLGQVVRSPLFALLCFNFFLQFGLAAVLHPAISIGSLRQRGTLLRVSGRLHVALMKRPELRQEIQARAAANLSVLCGFVQGIVVAEDKESVRKYFAEFPTRHHMYNYY